LELFLLLFREIVPPVRALDVELSNRCFVSGVLHQTGLREDAIRSLLLPAFLTLTAMATTTATTSKWPKNDWIHCFVDSRRYCQSATRAEMSPLVDPPRERRRCLVSIHRASEDLGVVLLFNYVLVLAITVHNRLSCSSISLPKWSF
jgi:hypothetical protein